MLIIGHSASCKKWLYFWSINWKLQIKVLACFNKTEVVISLQNKTDSSIFILVILLLFIAGIFMSSADWHDAINWYCNFKKCCAQLTMFIRSFLLMYLIQHLFYFYIVIKKWFFEDGSKTNSVNFWKAQRLNDLFYISQTLMSECFSWQLRRSSGETQLVFIKLDTCLYLKLHNQ